MIGILTSGATLGVHVPGLLLARRLREAGVAAEVTAIESLLPLEKQAVVADLKWAYHRNYRFALASRRVGRDTAADLAEEAVRARYRRWREGGVRHLVVFSGHWLPLLHGYREFCGEPVRVDLCRGDAAPMHSFVRSDAPPYEGAREIRLADGESGTLPWTIPVSRAVPVGWPARARRLVVHGGGWGLGTYRQRAAELAEHGFALDLVAYEPRDVAGDRPGLRRFMIDPGWHPWLDDGFPPFAEVPAGAAGPGAAGPGAAGPFTRGEDHPGVFDLVRDAIAIVSKPGAGTLLDSLWAATPLVTLEPWTDSEASNARLWQRLGFGVDFDRWRESGFSRELLAELHQNLRSAAPTVADYPAALAAETAAASAPTTSRRWARVPRTS